MSNPKFKKVKTGNIDYLKLNDIEPGTIIVNEQKFLGTKESTRFAGQFSYLFDNGDDRKIGVPGAGKLKFLMEGIEEGDVVLIKYLGKTKIESGNYKGTNAHDFEVLVEDTEAA